MLVIVILFTTERAFPFLHRFQSGILGLQVNPMPAQLFPGLLFSVFFDHWFFV